MAYLDSVTRLGPGGGPRPQYVGFSPAAGTATVTGSFTESQIVSGGQQIVITLTNDTWIADITAQRQGIIDGLTSAQTETLGWNNEVRNKEVVGAVVRTSDTIVTITLTASPLYDITADEVITLTIPGSALSGATPLVATPTIGVSVVADTSASPSGGWARIYDRYYEKRTERKEKLKEDLLSTQNLEPTDREIAKLLHEKLEYEARTNEIRQLDALIKSAEKAEISEYNDKVFKAYERAMIGSFSTIEAFEREMDRAREEEEFLLLSMLLIE